MVIENTLPPLSEWLPGAGLYWLAVVACVVGAALVLGGPGMVEMFADHQPQHGIAQKFQTFERFQVAGGRRSVPQGQEI